MSGESARWPERFTEKHKADMSELTDNVLRISSQQLQTTSPLEEVQGDSLDVFSPAEELRIDLKKMMGLVQETLSLSTTEDPRHDRLAQNLYSTSKASGELPPSFVLEGNEVQRVGAQPLSGTASKSPFLRWELSE
jgi:hypothetical protein